MGEKHLDQHHASPGEGGATDYRARRQVEEGLTPDVDKGARPDKRRASGRDLIPEKHVNPEVERLRREHEAADADIEFSPDGE